MAEAPAAPPATPPQTPPAAPPPNPAPPATPPATPPAEPPKTGEQPPKKDDAPAAKPEKKTILGGEPPKDGAQPKPQSAPKEGYADFKLPEGIEPNAKLMDGFKGLAKELDLSQDAAQKTVDLWAQNLQAEIDNRMADFESQVEEWGKQSEALFGDKSKEAFGVADTAVARFGDAALRQLLQETGLGNHPSMVKFCHAVGMALKEDKAPGGRSAGDDSVSTAALMFDKMEPKKK